MDSSTENGTPRGDDSKSGGSPAKVAFVSRRQAAAGSLELQAGDALGGQQPFYKDQTIRLLLLLTALLQAISWANLQGYQLADSVEFMDRAFAVVRGEQLDTTGAVRSFGFSTLLLPFFALADWMGMNDMRLAVHAVRLFQMLLGLALVVSTVRLGARVGGRRVGYVSGLFVAANPIFLQYSVDPVSGVAAALLVATGLNRLIVRRSFRHSLIGGLMLGAAFMMAYQTLLIAMPLIGTVLLRDRLRVRHTWGGALIGFSVAVMAQIVLDKVTYNTWGISVSSYVIENTGGTFFSLLSVLGLQNADWVRDAYESYAQSMGDGEATIGADPERRSLQSPFFYLLNISSMLVLPALLCIAFGVLRAWKELNWKTSLLLLVLLINVGVMSFKGSKSFRLWLPLLPLIAPICALGWELFASSPLRPSARWRRIAGPVLIAATVVMGMSELGSQDTRRYGAYWDAMEFVNSETSGEESIATVGAAYNWAIFGRNRAQVKVVKFKQHLDHWVQLSPAQREPVLQQLAELDWLITHGTILRMDPDLNRAINARFEVAASFWSESTDPTIRDVRVFRRPQEQEDGQSGPRKLFAVIENEDPAEYRERLRLDLQMATPLTFVGDAEINSQERLHLLGYEVEPLPGSEFHWITYHWYSDTGFERDYVIVDRVSTLQSPWAWQNNHQPGHGALPTSTWKAGWIVREGYLLAPGEKAFDREQFRPFGGSYRRGDLVSAMLWMRAESPAPNVDEFVLVVADPENGAATTLEHAEVALEEIGWRTPAGFILTSDRLVRAGKFLLPVADRYRWPDDGHPGPDAEAIALQQRSREQESASASERAAGSAGQ